MGGSSLSPSSKAPVSIKDSLSGSYTENRNKESVSYYRVSLSAGTLTINLTLPSCFRTQSARRPRL
jgi:hypothetical protein